MQYHVVPHQRGWAVKRTATARSSFVCATKQEAVARAKELAKSAGCELVVHDSENEISNPNSYGGDSRRHTDRKR